jgi:hypothetical protein
MLVKLTTVVRYFHLIKFNALLIGFNGGWVEVKKRWLIPSSNTSSKEAAKHKIGQTWIDKKWFWFSKKNKVKSILFLSLLRIDRLCPACNPWILYPEIDFRKSLNRVSISQAIIIGCDLKIILNNDYLFEQTRSILYLAEKVNKFKINPKPLIETN